MFGTMDWGKLAKASTATVLMMLLTLHPIATQPAIAAWGKKQTSRTEVAQPSKLAGKLTEVAPPAAIQELRQSFDNNQPQVTIQSPRPNEVLNDDTVSVQFQVRDLDLFKDKNLGLGPHLHVFLDNQPYQAVYDPTKPLVLEKLAPGTHTIRAFASRPWHESFKNEGAYAQTTFHVFTKTGDHSPDSNLPLLTYSRPQATYGAEPIMLDFYLTNAPLHLVAQETQKDDIADWRIRCTVNGDSFVLDQWQPIYLKGFKPGKNWVQLEFLDENGNSVKNVFNNTARVITYEPGGKDALSKLVRGDLSVADARGMVDANYKPPMPAPIPSPTPSATPAAKPSPAPVPVPVAPVVKATPTPVPSTSPAPTVKSVPVSQPSPSPASISPTATKESTPKPKATPKPEATPNAIASPKSVESPEAAAPTPTPAPKPAKSPVKDLLSRFRKEPREKKPVSVPVIPPPSSISAPVPSSAPVAPPKPVEIVPKTGEIERPKSVEMPKVETPKVETPKMETPKAETPKLEVPQTVTAPATPQPVPTAKSTPTLRATPTTQFPVVAAPQPTASPSARSPLPSPVAIPQPVKPEEQPKSEPARPLTPAQQS
ncbi:MAG: hypothetical protein NW220_03100 [Leptolyngbyaceae cyanobacterium bins.349]|nr:hypothetical protein [Leptolyngbyaceae cyanobacterium bins.349]